MKQFCKYFSPYRSWLYSEYSQRKEKNSTYSLRAFSRDLGVSKTSLSDVFLCQRNLSISNATKIAEKLTLPTLEKELFLREVKNSQGASAKVPSHLSLEALEEIHPWYYFAILSMARLTSTPSCAEVISTRLGLPKKVIADALVKLGEMQLLVTEGGVLKRTGAPLWTKAELPAEVTREHHRQFLTKAMEVQELIPASYRCYQTMTMAINPRQLERAKKLIEEFKGKIATILEDGDQRDVYTLAIQLFPLYREGIKSTDLVADSIELR